MSTRKSNPISEDIISRTKVRVDQINIDVDQILTNASTNYRPMDLTAIVFQIYGVAPRATLFLPEDEAVFNSFLRKSKTIPKLKNPTLIQENGIVKIGNLDNTKSFISELRPIFFNESDSIYFLKIHNAVCRLLQGIYDNGQVKLSVHRRTQDTLIDITLDFVSELKSRKRVVLNALKASDLDYLYNGVLQHSDSRFHERHQTEYLSGELNFTILKNAQILAALCDCIEIYTPCLDMLWHDGFPTEGSL